VWLGVTLTLTKNTPQYTQKRHVKGLGPSAVVVVHDPCTRKSLRGSMQEGKERAREGRHLLEDRVVTDDTSQLPMSWSNKFAEANTVTGPTHATKQHKTHHTNKKNEARSEFKKGLQTDSQGEGEQGK
jgi:hypothetical protein